MRMVIQRVTEASVDIGGQRYAQIAAGLLVLAGFEPVDSVDDIGYCCQKLVNLRIFNDADGVMNRSILETDGEILLVSQFTLHASTRKGNRPSYIRAARPELAMPLYELSIKTLAGLLGKFVQSGSFGADMQVSLRNDGPVTIIIDSKLKEF